MTDTKDEPNPIKQRGSKLGCLRLIAIFLGIFAVECVWNHSQSWRVRNRHREAAHQEIIAGKSGAIYNPLSWFYAWPHAIWFYDPKGNAVRNKTAIFTVWLKPNDQDKGSEDLVIARINGESGDIEMRSNNSSSEKWFPIGKDEVLHDELVAILSK